MEISDRVFILEGKYPLFPFLPVKRYKEGAHIPECGFMVYGAPNKVYLMSFWEYVRLKKPVAMKDIPTARYDTIDELLADGWVVD